MIEENKNKKILRNHFISSEIIIKTDQPKINNNKRECIISRQSETIATVSIFIVIQNSFYSLHGHEHGDIAVYSTTENGYITFRIMPTFYINAIKATTSDNENENEMIP